LPCTLGLLVEGVQLKTGTDIAWGSFFYSETISFITMGSIPFIDATPGLLTEINSYIRLSNCKSVCFILIVASALTHAFINSM